MAKYTFNDSSFSEEELLEIAESKGYTLEELFEKNPGIKQTDTEVKIEETETSDIVKEAPSQETESAAVEENVALDPTDTGLISEDISSGLAGKVPYNINGKEVTEKQYNDYLANIDKVGSSLDLESLSDPKKRKELEFTYGEEQKYLRNKTIPARIIDQVEPPSILKSLISKTARGFVSTGKGFEDFNNMIALNIADLATPNLSKEDKVEMKQFLDSGGLKSLAAGVFPMAGLLPSSNNYKKIMDGLSESVRKLDSEGVTEAISKGDYAQAAELAVGGALESLPSVLAAATGYGGIAMLGTTVAGNKFSEEFDANPDKALGTLALNAIGTGVTEATFELFTRGLLKKAGIIKNELGVDAAKKIIQEGVGNFAKRIGINTAKEGFYEGLTEGVNILNDSLILGKEFSFKEIFFQMTDGAIIGSVMGGSIGSLSELGNSSDAIRNRAEYILSPVNVKQDYAAAADELSQLAFDLKNTESDEGKKLVLDQINKIEDNITIAKAEVSRGLNSLTKEELSEYASNQGQILEDQKTSYTDDPDSVKKLAKQRIEDLQQKNYDLFTVGAQRALETEIETISQVIKPEDINVVESVEDFKIQYPNIDPDADAFIEEDGKIVINKERAVLVGAVKAGSHELLHKILRSQLSNKEAAQTLIEDFKNTLTEKELRIVQKRIDDNYRYKRDAKGNIIGENALETYNEEYLTVFSDAVGKGEIKFQEDIFTKIGNFITNIIRPKGYEKLNFKEGKDVYNFIKDYQKNIAKGKVITKPEEGIKDVIKESRSEDASNKVQKLYEEKGADGAAFEIIEQFKPIVNKIVEKRRNAPGFDKQLLTDEIETGTGGILDLIKAYDPTSNVPLAAYINKYLPVRSITASRKILGEEFTDDITESPSVAAEAAPEVEVEVAEKAPAKKLKEVKETLSEENQTELKNVVAKLNLTEDQLTFKTLPNAAIEIFAKQIGIPAKKFDGKANFTRDELDKVINFIEENVSTIRQALPEAAVAEGSPVSENLIGTATGVPNNLLKDSNLYTRQDRGTRLSGLIPYIKNKGIDNSSILKAIGNVDGRRMAGPRDKQAQTAKGLINMLAKFATNQEVRKQKTLTPKQRSNVEVGKGSKLLFSKSMELPILNSLRVGGNQNELLSIKFSKSSKDAYEKILIGRRPELRDAPEQVDNLFKWVDTLDIPENKKSKHEKLALFYMGNGNLILPEDGYKVEDAIKVAAKNKLDPFSYKNPNELLEKFAGDISPKKINPDNLSTFSNKQELADGITTYEIEDSRAGQADVRKIIDSNWGKKANPWCLAALIDGNLDQAWDYWKRYSGKKQIAFQNNKLLAFNAFDQYNPLADPRWYDRMDKATEGLVFYKKINDPRGLKLKLELNTKNNSTKQIGYEVGSPKSNFYQEYNIDKELIAETKRTATKEVFFNDTLKSNAVEEWKNGDEGAKFDLVFYTPIENGILEEDPIDFEDADSDLQFWDRRTAIDFVKPDSKKDRYGNRQSTNSKYIYESVNPKQKYIVQAKLGGEFGYIVEYKELNGVKFLTGRDIINNYVMPDKKAPPEQLEFAKNLESVSKLIGTTYGQLLGEIHDTAFLLDSDNKPIIPIKFPFLNTSNKGEFEIDPINEIGKGSRLLFSKTDKNKFDKIFKNAPEEVLKYGMLLNVKPTNKAINSVLAKIEEELPIDVYDEYFEKYFKPFIEFRKFAQKQKWPWAEEKVKNTLKTLSKNNPDLKLKNIKLNKDSQKVDIQFEQNGKLVLVEVKKNYEARISQIYLYKEANGQISTNRTADKIYEDKIAKADKTRDVLIDRIYRDYEKYVEKTIDANGRVQYIVPIFTIEAARESLKKDKIAYETTIKMPIGLAVSLYNTKANKAKNVAGLLISFGDLGTFYIGENKMQFPVPSFEQEGMELTVRIMDRYNPRKTPVIFDGKSFSVASLSRIAVNTLTPKAVEILENTPSLSLQNESQARAIFKSSLSKSDATIKNNLELPKSQRLPKDSTNEQVLAKMQELDDQANEARIKYSKSQDLDDTFNKIIENKTGIKTYQRFDRAGATVRGASKGKFNFFIPPSAEDFVGLLYKTLGKGKVGDSQMQFYKDNLLDPYGRAMNDVSSARVAMFEDYKTLKEDLNIIPKDLSKKGVEEYTREQAVRVYIWDQQENKIPGIFKTNQQKLVNYVNANPDLKQFGDQLIAMQKGDEYVTPKEGWLAGTITTDLLDSVNSIKRKKYLEQWQTNVDEMFGESNMNKLEAAFGKPYRRALEDALGRMKSGRNKKFTAGNEQVNAWTNWVNNSVGTIMFLNSRSAILQTLSTVNFLNFEDNNVFKAGAAFANQPQYWKDFKFLFNSDFLKERRGGLRFNVSESEIADAAKRGGARGVVSKILQAGFLPTQMADSFAIAAGGATFYRNRLNTYLKETDADGNKIYTEAEAQEKTFLDFRETAEESQQSSRPDRISMEQAGPLGRTILAFANTPAQYTRIMKKAVSDIKNGRGSLKANVSRLIYYGVVQNVIFGAIQSAMFSLAFGDGDDEDQLFEEKSTRIANGTADSILRGAGLYGAIAATIKNTAIKLIKESKKPRTDYFEAGLVELAGISPPIQSKVKKWRSATKSYEYNKKEMAAKGFSLDSPSYLAGANVIAAFTNVPTDRVVKKVTNVYDAMQEDVEVWKRTALLMGWSKWELEPTVKKSNKSKRIKVKTIKSKTIKSKTIKSKTIN